MFLRREAVAEHGFEFPEGIQPCEGGLFSHFLLALTDRIAFCPKAVYHYSQHQQSDHHQPDTEPNGENPGYGSPVSFSV